MIPISALQFRSALDCAITDHGALWELTGFPADEIGDSVAVALWFSPEPGAAMPWLRCDVDSNGGVHHLISSGAPLDVWTAAEVNLPH